MERTRVLVVGAGPVGAIAAYRLALHGIDVVLLEAEASCPEDMRASTLHPPTIAMLAELGVLAELDAQGLRAPIYHYRNRRTGEILAFDFGEIADATPYPYRLQCEQFKISRLLARLISQHPQGRIRFSHRVIGFEQDGARVKVHIETPFAIEHIEADYLIAADGANSIIRKWLNVPFDGFTYPEKFLTLSTAFPLETALPGLAAVNYVADPVEWCVLLRVPSLWRVLVPTAEDESDGALLSDTKKEVVFRGLVGEDAARTLATGHRTVYRVHQRVARTYHAGRVLLAGDAAHLNNPLGGFGMNSGVHDVWNLTDKLIELYSGKGEADALLSRYDRQRRTVMHEFVQAQTIRNKKVLESGNADAQTENQRMMADILSDDRRRRDYLLNQSMVASLQRAAEIR